MEYIHFVESKNSAGLLVISTLTDAVTSQIDILCDTIKDSKTGCHSRLGPNRNSLAFPASFQSYYHIGKLIIEGVLLSANKPVLWEDNTDDLMRFIRLSLESGYPVYIAGSGPAYLLVEKNRIADGITFWDGTGTFVMKEFPAVEYDNAAFDRTLRVLLQHLEHPQTYATRIHLQAVFSNNLLRSKLREKETVPSPGSVLAVIEQMHRIVIDRVPDTDSVADDIRTYLTAFCDLWDDVRINQILTNSVHNGLSDPVYLEPCVTKGFQIKDVIKVMELVTSDRLDMEFYHYAIQSIRTLCASYGIREEDALSECCLRRNRSAYSQLIGKHPDAQSYVARRLSEITFNSFTQRSAHNSPNWKNEYYHLTAIQKELEGSG